MTEIYDWAQEHGTPCLNVSRISPAEAITEPVPVVAGLPEPTFPSAPQLMASELATAVPISALIGGDFDAVIDAFFNNSEACADLWIPAQSLGSISLGELGIYSLAIGNETDTVADWTPRYAAARESLEGPLSDYISQSVHDIGKIGVRLPEILTSQVILAEPVLNDDEMALVTEKLASTSNMGFDYLIVLSGLLTKRDLAIILASLPETRLLNAASKNSIKMDARTVDNKLFDDTEQDDEDTESVVSFKATLSQALASDEVQEYSADIWGAKIFLKKESESRVAIIRRVDIGNFAAWLKAYEAHDIWKKLGFSHLPVEPILDFDFQQGTVDVRTIPLRSEGFAAARKNAEPDTLKALDLQRQNIKRGLDRIGVIHGHLHSDNLQVVDTKDGPRVYVIDFDAALIKKDLRQ